MKKLLNRRIAIVAVAVIATVAFFSFKSGDDRNFQIAKNLDIFNAIVKELDMFYVDTIDPNKTIREGIDNMLYTLDPYTEYFPEEDQSELEKMIKGSFGGMGSYIAYNTKLKRSMISEPFEGTPAAKAGLKAGDILMEINHQAIEDVFDYRYLLNDEYIELLIQKANGELWELDVEKDYDEDLGIEFENGLMDDYRSCSNHCMFCFIEQMPPGMRPSLYVRDDDWRLSLMAGNFVTLTNLPPQEMDRMIERHASPLYISVQTTNGELRKKMLHHIHADRIMEHLRRFADHDMSFHCQVVLCPGINDGPELERTMRDLASLAPHALTVALVPVGLTKYREHLYPLRPYTQEEAEQVIRQAEAFQKEMLAAHGTRFVFPSDEFYQIAKHPLPDVDSYEDFPQFENGVGLLCRLKDEYETAVRLDPDEGQAEKRRVIMACGTSVAPFLRELITSHPVSGVDIRIKPIVNYFFGETVTVSGLITGQDLVAQLKGEEADEILITESMLRQGEEIFLDDMTLEQAQQQLGIRITPVPDDGADLLYALRGTEE